MTKPARHGAASATTHRMLLIQFQEHSGRAVSCPFAPYRRNRRRGIHTRIVRACVRPGFHKLDYAPDEMSVRDASGYPERREAIQSDSARSFPLLKRSPPFFSSRVCLYLFLLFPRSHFFRGDRIRELTDAGITILFVRPAGSDAADSSHEFLSRFVSGE